jgi:hypothetical protein
MTHKVDAVAEGKRFALTKKFGATVYNGWANSGEYNVIAAGASENAC